MQLPPYWQVTPIGLVAVLVGIAHEIGLRRLALRQTPEHRRKARRRSWVFYAGLAGLVLVVSGPLDRWSMAPVEHPYGAAHLGDVLSTAPVDHRRSLGAARSSPSRVDQRRRLLRGYHRSRGRGGSARPPDRSRPIPSSPSSSSTA